jgi:tRNA-dihydrouridine synthase A
MREPGLVQECLAAMVEAGDTPVSAKIRLGIDELDDEDYLQRFAERIVAAGCRDIIVHARKAMLGGLTPRENREIPPLRYDVVYRLKARLPYVRIQLNGGVRSLDDIRTHLRQVDAVMVGRKAYEDPYFLATVQSALLEPAASPARSRLQVVEEMIRYAEHEMAAGTRLHQITRHMTGLFRGTPGARHWRRFLSEHACRPDARPSLLRQAVGAWPPVRQPGELRVA